MCRSLFAALALCSIVATAHASTTFRDWVAGVTHDGASYYAATTNASGEVFGQWCSRHSGDCVWLIGMSVGCDRDSAYPVLANSGLGGESLTITCGGTIADTNLSRYSFSDFDSITKLVSGAGGVGFAIPMQSDQFRVVRFSLVGATQALNAMHAVAQDAEKDSRKSTSSDTRDETL